MKNTFDKFRQKDKFEGSVLQKNLSEKINQISFDFENLGDNATNEECQKIIQSGLEKFYDIYLEIDTEDREQICVYFEELMDISGINSSDGKLNNFMYGF